VPSVLGPALDEAGDSVQTVQVDGQVVDYLAVNTRSKAMRTTTVRRALADATDRAAYTQARGAASGTPTWSLLGSALPSAHESVVDNGPSGDAAQASKRLAEAKVRTPVKISVAYRGGGTMDEAMK